MKRQTLISLGWIAANASLIGLLFGLEMAVNFINWRPEWTLESVGCVAGLVALVVFIGYLSCITREETTFVFAVVASIVAVLLVLRAVSPEPLGTGWFARTAPSPAWYRWGRLVVGCVPLVATVVAGLRKAVRTEKGIFDTLG